MSEETETKELKPSPSSVDLARFCGQIADDRKGTDVIVMDLSDLSAVAEYFVICTGTSSPHLRAISERIHKDAKETYGLHSRVDGTPESGWMITDFGNVMVHIFTDEARKLYQLENLWGDAPKVEAVRKLEEKAVSSRLR